MSDAAKSATGSGFGQFVPGFEFLQNLAGGAGLAKAAPQLPSLGSWVAPTFNVEDLEKRIEELKAVQFWLDQNGKALAATIQALEVQKMTLVTLKTMNLRMGDVAQSLGDMMGMAGHASAHAQTPAATQFAGLEIPPRNDGTPTQPDAQQQDSAPDTPDAGPSDKSGSRAAAGANGAIDPMQWWGALTQQFQQIASTALQDASRQMTAAADGASPAGADAPGTQGRRAKPAPARKAAPAPAVAKRRPAARKTPAKKAAAPKPKARQPQPASPQPLVGADWPMPSAFFQMPGFPQAAQPAKKKTANRQATARPAATKTSRARPAKPATSTRKNPSASRSR